MAKVDGTEKAIQILRQADLIVSRENVSLQSALLAMLIAVEMNT
jgi:hypothetical protein